ncbi:MAG: bifunctional 5,10-methylenetetrahydrofolate dehydrogenase/5,10-methenyltetrahydrofolate cyclohydrolase [Caulobacteraceae bacterium]
MTQILRTKELVQNIKQSIREEASMFEAQGIKPALGIVRVGNRPDDIAYENSIIKNCESVNMKVCVFKADPDISMDEFKNLIKRVNEDESIHGILMFRPLPKHLDYHVIKHLINPAKDIDCSNPINLAKVFEGNGEVFYPSTPEAVVEILKHFNVPLEGRNVVIINRSVVVGKPLAMMLLKENATVTICNSKTRNLSDITSHADVVVCAVAKARLFDAEYFQKDSVVIDVGINQDSDGKLCGDVDFDKVCNKVHSITPVPGGVGSVTTALLLKHVIKACRSISFNS